MQIACKAPSQRVSTIMGRLRRRALKAGDRLLIHNRSSRSQPILVKTRSVQDLVRGSSIGAIESREQRQEFLAFTRVAVFQPLRGKMQELVA